MIWSDIIKYRTSIFYTSVWHLKSHDIWSMSIWCKDEKSFLIAKWFFDFSSHTSSPAFFDGRCSWTSSTGLPVRIWIRKALGTNPWLGNGKKLPCLWRNWRMKMVIEKGGFHGIKFNLSIFLGFQNGWQWWIIDWYWFIRYWVANFIRFTRNFSVAGLNPDWFMIPVSPKLADKSANWIAAKGLTKSRVYMIDNENIQEIIWPQNFGGAECIENWRKEHQGLHLTASECQSPVVFAALPPGRL